MSLASNISQLCGRRVRRRAAATWMAWERVAGGERLSKGALCVEGGGGDRRRGRWGGAHPCRNLSHRRRCRRRQTFCCGAGKRRCLCPVFSPCLGPLRWLLHASYQALLLSTLLPAPTLGLTQRFIPRTALLQEHTCPCILPSRPRHSLPQELTYPYILPSSIPPSLFTFQPPARLQHTRPSTPQRLAPPHTTLPPSKQRLRRRQRRRHQSHAPKPPCTSRLAHAF